MSQPSVAQVFQMDHDNLIWIINQYFKGKQSHQDNQQTLSRFIWAVDRHLYLEEKALVFYLDLKPAENEAMLLQFYREHNEILQQVDKIRKNLEYDPTGIIPIVMNQLKDLIATHKAFEMREFYSKIDQNLGVQDRAKIIKSLNQSIASGFFPLSKVRDSAKKLFVGKENLLALL